MSCIAHKYHEDILTLLSVCSILRWWGENELGQAAFLEVSVPIIWYWHYSGAFNFHDEIGLFEEAVIHLVHLHKFTVFWPHAPTPPLLHRMVMVLLIQRGIVIANRMYGMIVSKQCNIKRSYSTAHVYSSWAAVFGSVVWRLTA